MRKKKANFYPVILASRRSHWPATRKPRAEELTVLDGEPSMIQRTVIRLLPHVSIERLWVITDNSARSTVKSQFPEIEESQIILEPVDRSSGPAIGLAAFILLRCDPSALVGTFPAGHFIRDEKLFRETLQKGINFTGDDNIVVLGVRPTRPETNYGYIELGQELRNGVWRVSRFTEKPHLKRAEEFVRAGNYLWCSGMFLSRVRTLAEALLKYLPTTAPYLEEIAAAYGTRKFESTLRSLYPKCERISFDYAVLEPLSARGEASSNIFCLPCAFGWEVPNSTSCFISYSTKDQRFANRLYADLTNRGVNCWFAGHDVRGGRKLEEQIDQAIRSSDRLLLVLSPHSMKSEWVKTEIAKARKREREQNRKVLFPIRLVDFATLRSWECFDADIGKDSAREIREYYIPDFSNWKGDPKSYKREFEKLLRDLEVEA